MNHNLQKQKAESGIRVLRETFPVLFNPMRPKPLALGISLQLANARRAGLLNISLLVQRAAMNAWLKTPNYQRALAITPCRYNLDGSVFGAVSDDHRQHAIDRLKAIRKVKKERVRRLFISLR